MRSFPTPKRRETLKNPGRFIEYTYRRGSAWTPMCFRLSIVCSVCLASSVKIYICISVLYREQSRQALSFSLFSRRRYIYIGYRASGRWKGEDSANIYISTHTGDLNNLSYYYYYVQNGFWVESSCC